MPLDLDALFAAGTTFTFNGTEIAAVTNIGGPGFSRATFDATHHKSPNRWRQLGKGLKSGGEITIDLNFMPGNTSHAALLADFAEDEVIADCALAFPDGTSWTFPGIVTGFTPSAPIDDKVGGSVTIAIAGQPVLA